MIFLARSYSARPDAPSFRFSDLADFREKRDASGFEEFELTAIDAPAWLHSLVDGAPAAALADFYDLAEAAADSRHDENAMLAIVAALDSALGRYYYTIPDLIRALPDISAMRAVDAADWALQYGYDAAVASSLPESLHGYFDWQTWATDRILEDPALVEVRVPTGRYGSTYYVVDLGDLAA